MILLIDNYDSFTWNLVHQIAGLGYQAEVVRNDALTVTEALALKPEAIVLSPGPCTPDEAGICVDLSRAAAETETPLLGVCLGHQSIARAFGGEVVRAGRIMHGKTSEVFHEGSHIFNGLPQPFTAARYHSLVVRPETLPAEIEPLARAVDDDEIMGLKIAGAPVFGLQFHPESIASPEGTQLIENFLTTYCPVTA